MDIKLYEKLGRDPLAGKTSVGDNVRNDPTYDMIKTEINKLNTVGATAAPQWKVVAEASEKVLKNESKDLLVSSYLAYSLLETKGIEGLIAGLTAMQGMLNEHWDNLYPPVNRMQGRIAALKWLSDSLEKYCDRHKDVSYDYTMVAQLKVLMVQLDDFVAGKDQELSLHSAVRLVEGLATTPAPAGAASGSTPATHSTSSAATATSGGSAPMSGIPNADSVNIDSLAAANQAAGAGLSLLKRVASYYVEQQKFDHMALYIYKHLSLWVERYAYPKQFQGQTLINAPDRQDVDRLYNYYQRKSYQDLLKESLVLMDQYPHWIDLVYYTAYALSHMKQTSPACVRLIGSLMRDWIEAFPMLPHYTFAGGEVPFAREETLEWLGSLTPQAVHKNQDSAFSTFLEEFAKVEKRTGSGQLQAIMALQPYLKSSIPEAYKIELLVKTIDIFVLNQEKNFLSNVIKLLTDKIAYFHLAEWDVELAKKALIAIICGKKFLQENADTELEQLSTIDMGASILLQKAPVEDQNSDQTGQ